MKLAPHLHRLGNDIVASYLIDLPEGITLVDAGLPGHWHDLQRKLAVIGRPLSDIRGLVLTHGDNDHIGFAERLRRESGVPVYIHGADAHRVRTGEKPKTPMGPFRPWRSVARNSRRHRRRGPRPRLTLAPVGFNNAPPRVCRVQ